MFVETGVATPEVVITVLGVTTVGAVRFDGEVGSNGVIVGNVGGDEAAARRGEEFRELDSVLDVGVSPMLINGLI